MTQVSFRSENLPIISTVKQTEIAPNPLSADCRVSSKYEVAEGSELVNESLNSDNHDIMSFNICRHEHSDGDSCQSK